MIIIKSKHEVELLKDAGKITAIVAKKVAESEYEKFKTIQDKIYQSDFDKMVEERKKGLKDG